MGINAQKFNQETELFSVASRAASANGTGVDISEHVGTGKVILHSAAGGVGETMDVKIQDSPDNAVWTDISGATFTQVTNAAGGSLEGIGVNLDNINAYIRGVATIAGTFVFGLSMVSRKQLTP